MLSKVLYTVSFAIIGTIIVHISVLLLVPYVSLSFIERFEQSGQDWQFSRLDDANPILERQDPAFRIRVCRFDLRQGAVQLIGGGDVPFWSLSLYDYDGRNLYSINSRITPDAEIDLIIGTELQIMDYKQYGQDNQDEQLNLALRGSLVTEHNIEQGFVVLRAYSPSADWEGLVENFLNTARCLKIS